MLPIIALLHSSERALSKSVVPNNRQYSPLSQYYPVVVKTNYLSQGYRFNSLMLNDLPTASNRYNESYITGVKGALASRDDYPKPPKIFEAMAGWKFVSMILMYVATRVVM